MWVYRKWTRSFAVAAVRTERQLAAQQRTPVWVCRKWTRAFAIVAVRTERHLVSSTTHASVGVQEVDTCVRCCCCENRTSSCQLSNARQCGCAGSGHDHYLCCIGKHWPCVTWPTLFTAASKATVNKIGQVTQSQCLPPVGSLVHSLCTITRPSRVPPNSHLHTHTLTNTHTNTNASTPLSPS